MIITILEFYNTSIYVNINMTTCLMIILIGLHCTHITLGLYSSNIINCTITMSTIRESYNTLQSTLFRHYYLYIVFLVYWHYVDLLWFVIQLLVIL